MLLRDSGRRTAWTELRCNFAEMRSVLPEQPSLHIIAPRQSRRPEETECMMSVLIDADRENNIEAYQHRNSWRRRHESLRSLHHVFSY